MKMNGVIVIVALSGMLAVGQSMAAPQREQGDIWLRGGATQVFPKGDNNSIVDVDDKLGFAFNVTYMFRDDWAVEVLAAMPFKHDIRTKGKTPVGSVQHLPPTISLQYHPDIDGPFKPYVGAGLNITLFFDEEIDSAIGLGPKLDLDTVSFGPAVQAGVDFFFDDRTFINLDIRWADIDSDAEVTGGTGGTVDLGEVQIDPLIIGINFGWQF